MDAPPTSSAASSSPAQDILRQLLERYSQAELVRRSGISQSRMSRWVTHGVPDAADDALKLAALAKELAAEEAKAHTESEG